MPLSRRYQPELAPGETCVMGMDFSYVIPPGVGITAGTLAFLSNTVPPAPTAALTAGPVSVQGRALYATVSASEGAAGNDFRLQWTATDTEGNTWPRTALVLCAPTS